MRLLVHDPASDGHHPVMLREIVRALADRNDVVVAARRPLLEQAGELPADIWVLGEEAAQSASADLDAFDHVTARVRPDHRLHVYAPRPVLAAWVLRRRQAVPTSALVISPPALHYPRAYNTPLSASEWANALVKELLVECFRRRRDVHAVLTMDPLAAERWRRRGGGPAVALREPPVRRAKSPPSKADGAILLGALSPRKGFAYVVAALEHGADGLRLVLAGKVESGYEPVLAEGVARLRAGGVLVEEHLGWLGDDDMLALLAGARCALVPYVGHKGTSRIVTEAAAVGTPVVAHGAGLLGDQVRHYGLGLAVDARRPQALRAAILELARGPVADRTYETALADFAARSSPTAFGAAVCALFAD
jgi:glycosyltransferase involved in cell wall biosynthesis